jgi:serine/threonine-protein kinase
VSNIEEGTVLGDRLVLGVRLGSGSMGVVHEAVDRRTGLRVAVKVMHPHLASDPELVARFEREVFSVAALGHPHVVRMLAYERTGSLPYFVMELLDGITLGQVLREEGRLSVARVATIGTQLLGALSAAHRAGIVHRDIKPDNVVLCRMEGGEVAKLLDFGTAKLMHEARDLQLTREGVLLGTLSYMAPEQARGDAVDGRADLYSLAAVLYVALAGRRLFEAPSMPGLLIAIQQETPEPLTNLRPDLPAAMAEVIATALRKRPDQRFPTADAMAAALAASAPR